MKLKVIYLIPSLTVAGAEKVVVDLANGLDHQKFDVHIISLSNKIPLSYLLHDNVHLHTLGASFSFPWINYKVAIKLRKKFFDISPDIVHSHLWSILTGYLWFVPLRGKKTFHTVHIDGSHYRSKKLIYKLFTTVEIFTCKMKVCKIITISDAVDEMCNSIFKLKNRVMIVNGVDTNVFIPPIQGRSIADYKSDQIAVIHVGRFDPQKEHIVMIKSLDFLVNELNEKRVIFQFVGAGVECGLTDYVIEYGLTKHVQFLGVRKDVDKLYRDAQIGLFPSSSEGFGLTLAEKISSELPCVITDIETSLQITNSGKYANVIEVGDYKAIAFAIKDIIEYPELWLNRSKQGRVHMENSYSIVRNISKHEELYVNY
ncbi:glycosyltransferase [Vibrio fluvialis]|uniref:glycosyltransferase n=1 Tax=Vibrio fluvialis TaxID=676 RepID=UPI001F2591EE|nr:glycosyltransferase [Vibrio fluvialis]MCE7639648.1 glycosyltransferase [Vibrio fluvialis]UPO64707.1 glycosyltransferase [Vibrio fluvialis]